MSPVATRAGRARVIVADDLPGHEPYYAAALAETDVQFRFVDAATSVDDQLAADVLIVGICDRYEQPPGLALIERASRSDGAPAIHVVLGPVSGEVAERLSRLGEAGIVRLHRLTSIFCAPDRVRQLVDG